MEYFGPESLTNGVLNGVVTYEIEPLLANDAEFKCLLNVESFKVQN